MIELIAEEAQTLCLDELFARPAPIHADLGCGDGSLLQTLAAQYPDRNYLGVERLLHRVRSSARKAEQLPNVRIVRADTMFVLQRVLAAESVEAFYLLFPDPWPKRRHHRRRLITSEFLQTVRECLTIGGSLFVATDHTDYFAAIRQIAANCRGLAVANDKWNLPPTAFERKFVAAGIPIHRLELRKISVVA